MYVSSFRIHLQVTFHSFLCINNNYNNHNENGDTYEKIITIIIIQKHPVIHLHTIPIIIRIIVLKLLFFSLIFLFSCSQLYFHHQTLRNDLASSLFEPGSDQTARLKAVIHRQDTIILTGGRWKQNVMDWLQQKGF